MVVGYPGLAWNNESTGLAFVVTKGPLVQVVQVMLLDESRGPSVCVVDLKEASIAGQNLEIRTGAGGKDFVVGVRSRSQFTSLSMGKCSSGYSVDWIPARR